ncbi:preprotein translocase subunit SecA, partial [Streptomyces anthocyanicus]
AQVAVSLEYLPGAVTITSETGPSRAAAHGDLPWTVSLYDLRAISELVERPAELIVYLRRRTDPETTPRFGVIDELDLFLAFHDNGLYVEPDPRQVAQALPRFGLPGVAAARRR